MSFMEMDLSASSPGATVACRRNQLLSDNVFGGGVDRVDGDDPAFLEVKHRKSRAIAGRRAGPLVRAGPEPGRLQLQVELVGPEPGRLPAAAGRRPGWRRRRSCRPRWRCGPTPACPRARNGPAAARRHRRWRRRPDGWCASGRRRRCRCRRRAPPPAPAPCSAGRRRRPARGPPGSPRRPASRTPVTWPDALETLEPGAEPDIRSRRRDGRACRTRRSPAPPRARAPAASPRAR